jgi:LysR family transcriptional activator of glutamate synthase operon
LNPTFLRYFLSLAKIQHLNNAAKAIDVTPASLYAGVKALEKELGVRLYHTVGKSIQLTKEGSFFIAKAKDLLKLEAQVIKAESQIKKSIQRIS